MGTFTVEQTALSGLHRVIRQPIGDTRGFLCRLYSADVLSGLGFGNGINQINHTLTTERGAVRGMHFQHPPHTETKLVSCLRGSVFDVALDLRRGSPTFLQWHGEVLSAENHRALLIPVGFAHGFQTLEDGCELLYLHSEAYAPAAEGAVNAIDPKVGIEWPLPIGERSKRDTDHPMLGDEFEGIAL